LVAALAAATVVLAGTAGAYEKLTGRQALWTPPGSQATGARPVAIGELFSCMADDPSAVHWNPAGLAALDGIGAGLHYTSLPVEGSQQGVDFAGPAGKAGVFGASFRYATFGPVEVTDADGNRKGDFTPWDYATTVAGAHDIAGGLLVGASLSAGRRTLASDCGISDFYGSAGFLWAGAEAVKIGAVARNIGASVRGAERAVSYTVGMSGLVEDRDVQLTLGMAVQIVPGGVNSINLGAEDRIKGRYFLRGGYIIRLGDAGDDAMGGLGVGLGVMVAKLSVDYAYLPLERLGAMHQASLGYSFGRKGR
jgi:hypothetical protein